MVIFGLYLFIGIVALSAFDILTGRVKNKWNESVTETQLKTITGRKTATMLFLTAMLIFWPIVFFGFITRKTKEKKIEG